MRLQKRDCTPVEFIMTVSAITVILLLASLLAR